MNGFYNKNNKLKALVIALCLTMGTTYMISPLNAIEARADNIDPAKENFMDKTFGESYANFNNSGSNSIKDKIETTYISMNSEGSIKETVVTEKLSNIGKSETLKDYSNLKDIENTSGNEKFTKKGNNLSWKANGESIKYKGKTSDNLPINVKISYYLNCEKVSPKQIAGKSGNVSIRFDYSINKSHFINGQHIKHPYTVASGLYLNNDNFSDVSVSSGKVIDDGSKTIVMGIAFPEMNENLNISRSELDIPGSVVINAHTENFNIDGTYTIAMSGIMNDENVNLSDIKGKAEKIESALTSLGSAANKIDIGTKELNKGTEKLKNGTEKLKAGGSDAINGAENLNRGLKALSANSESLRNGASQVENKVFNNATKEIQNQLGDKNIVLSPSNYAKVIANISDGAIIKAESEFRNSLANSGISDRDVQNTIFSLAYNKMMADGKSEPSIEDIKNYINLAANTAKSANITAKYINDYSNAAINFLKNAGYTNEQLAEEKGKQLIILTSIEMGLTNGSIDKDELESQLNNAMDLLKAAKEYEIASQGASDNAKKLFTLAVGKEAPKKLKELKEELDSLEMFIAGIKQYTVGVDAASAGSDKLLKGLEQLNDGIVQLDNGAGGLASGADKLSDGMSRLNKEGIKKFVGVMSKSDLNNVAKRLDTVSEASKNEIFLGGKPESMTGESRIIFKSEAIKSGEE